MLAKFVAEAEGTQRCWRPRPRGTRDWSRPAPGIRRSLDSAHDRAASYLGRRAGEAIQNLKIDKITVWDSGNGGRGSKHGGGTADFLSSLIGSLPAIHELAEQAGIELPAVLGKVIRNSARSEPTETKVVEVEELVKADEP